jgi:uncharacterized coiled-coil protein SlyX
MKDLNYQTLIVAVLIPLIIVGLGMWRTYTTMDLVYAKQSKVYDIEKTQALQAKDYELIKLLIAQLNAKVDKNHEELKKLITKDTQ